MQRRKQREKINKKGGEKASSRHAFFIFSPTVFYAATWLIERLEEATFCMDYEAEFTEEKQAR